MGFRVGIDFWKLGSMLGKSVLQLSRLCTADSNDFEFLLVIATVKNRVKKMLPEISRRSSNEH
jgi:hypothetical protein